MMLDTESVNQTVEVIAALCKRIISRNQQRHCFACIKELPLLEGEHLCLAQSPSEVVDLFFEDSYRSINNNLVNALLLVKGDFHQIYTGIKEHHNRHHLQGSRMFETDCDCRIRLQYFEDAKHMKELFQMVRI